ncbi:ABC transporter substrate-binding protein [Deinococcus radiophilus]|uniref:ABC transporter substrate-binding protein n=3 Tax=Deinococcus radiophilus TaxID=32062 RepID=A0A431VQ11_9DEIO|nr:ABC transporter substrate-binding protein [Deinococcus radiophilus]
MACSPQPEASTTPASNDTTTATSAETDASGTEAAELRLGVFPNVTHTAGLVGIHEGTFQKSLGGTALKVSHFANGSQINEAFAAGALDAAYVGPGPAMNAFMQGVPLKIYAGAAKAGAVLVAREGSDVEDVPGLSGAAVAVPTRGSTQDISLRHLLHENGLAATDEGGDVTIVPINPADMPAAFSTGQVEAALVQEPWGVVLENQGGKLIVDERGIWADGDYTTTVLVVSTEYAEQHPEALRGLLAGHLKAVNLVTEQPDVTVKAVADQIEEMTDKRPADDELEAALARTDVSWDINLDSMGEYAALNEEAGFARQSPDLNELVDLSVIKELAGE